MSELTDKQAEIERLKNNYKGESERIESLKERISVTSCLMETIKAKISALEEER